MNQKNKQLQVPAAFQLDSALQCLVDGTHHDPFSILGVHKLAGRRLLRAFLPQVESAKVEPDGPVMERIDGTDLFVADVSDHALPARYQFSWIDKLGKAGGGWDPYCFLPQISDFDLHLFGEGKHWHIYNVLGAHPHTAAGVTGTLFATWAPNAQRVSVVGDFNDWDGRRHPMRSRSNGVWELFLPGVSVGELYKYEILNRDTKQLLLKADPYGQQHQCPPETGSVVLADSSYQWNDKKWLQQRAENDWLHQPMSVYEVHLGSWRRADDNQFLSYKEMADELVGYVKEMGYTHVEFLPITEHPYDPSWGYQTTGFFAPTSRFGTPDECRYLIDCFHQENIGVILDWVPAHFPKDAHGLANFDGTALYEHADPRQGEHRDWGTLIFNYGRSEVKNFLLASAVYWLQELHIDGLRVDAVASMLYLDYSREEDDWIPNEFGGNENLAAIAFMRDLNHVTQSETSGALMIAEESTAWPEVTRPPDSGGLGFAMKWNMGWMHDTLKYMSEDPVNRSYHHNQLTFGLLYAFTENFVLPFSHDEVVHGKGSMINKMPGDDWQKFANLRLLYSYMFTYPGKKLLFMGCDFAQREEWNQEHSLDWHLLDYAPHQGINQLTKDLNHLYKEHPALYEREFQHDGFEWLQAGDHEHSVLAYLRKSANQAIVVILNFTPVPRHNYRVGLPVKGAYRELFNSDSSHYGGGNVGNPGLNTTDDLAWTGFDYSLSLNLPPLAAVVLIAE